MYPADLGEAAAVERSVGHALVVVLKSEHARVKLGVNHPMMPPHADKQREDECDHQPAQYRGEVKDVFQHSSPHGLHQPCQHAEVDDEQQTGAEGYAVKDGHLVTSGLSKTVEEVPSPHRSPKCMCRVTVDNKKSCVVEKHRAAENSDSNPYELKEQPTQHLRLRVVWQGLLT